MDKNRYWLGVSLFTIIAAIAVIVLVRPLWGIDFTGGSLVEIKFAEDKNVEMIRGWLEANFDEPVSVQQVGEQRLAIKTVPLAELSKETLLNNMREANLIEEELRFESIGPTIGAELRRKSLWAIVLVVTVLVAYLAYTFRQARDLMQPWKFGVAAVYALVHDLLLVTALFVILGRVNAVAIDSLFVTAMLAILGYSINDTIVVFNRMKVDYFKNRQTGTVELLDGAVQSSLVRSLNTSLTTLLVLTALFMMGGSTIRWFVVALMAGTMVGTYSSLLVAPPMLVWLSQSKSRKK